MLLNPKILFAALLVYVGWMMVRSKSESGSSVYILLIVLSSLMYNREGLINELKALGVMN